MRGTGLALVVLVAGGCGGGSALPAPADAASGCGLVPVIDVGLDAYRHWERWPYLAIGERAYVRSTYDRAGGNEAADASHFLREDDADHAVTLDVAGEGVLAFVRTNRWHGSPWHYEVDGSDQIVAESSSADPTSPVANATFLPESSFPSPLALTSTITAGADLSWVPIPFEHTLALAYGRTHFGTGYYVYDLFPQGATNLSRPITSFDGAPPDPSVLALLARAGEDLAPTGSGVTARSGTFDLAATGRATIADLTGPSVLRVLSFDVPRGEEQPFGRARLRVTWDGRSLPSIDAPVSLFFGTGSLYNRTGRRFLVQALPVVVRFDATSVHFAIYLPMPFQRMAHLELAGSGQAGDDVTGVAWQLRTVPYADPPNFAGYLHATYHDHGTPIPGHDLVLLDTTVDEGGGAVCGNIAGSSLIFSDRAVLTTLEGDPRFFFDGSETPQVQGTGTEEWGGGGDYWDGGQQTTLPLAGHPVGAPGGVTPLNAEDAIESEYRFLLADRLPFGASARVQLEHGGADESTEHYRSVVYWYGLPGACLVETDSLHVSDLADEAAHHYLSPDASPVDTLTSRYEWGVDHLNGVEIYPATTDTGRHTTGTSQLTLALRPDNLGVLLRRKLDYGYPDQRAEVYVADDRDGAPFVDAGTWYLAGSNTCLFLDPSTELGSVAPTVESSNRRFRDDEFLLPPALTEGRSSIRLRIQFTPANRPLYPGAALAPQAWSEYRYSAFAWLLPPAP